MNTKIYSAYFPFLVAAAGGIGNSQFIIPCNNNKIKIKSLLLDLRIDTDLVPPPAAETVPYNDPTQNFVLTLGGAAGVQIASMFIYVAGTNFIGAAETIRITRPDQYFFDQFYIVNNLPIQFNATNNDLLRGMNYYPTLIIEVEESEL